MFIKLKKLSENFQNRKYSQLNHIPHCLKTFFAYTSAKVENIPYFKQ